MSFWKNKSVLVTGATGLVGSWLVHELLKQGSNVTALVLDNDPASQLFRSGDIDRISVVSGNLSSYHDVARSMYTNECTEVFHLGAQTIVGTALLDPISTFESNVQGTWNVLEAVRQSKGLVKAVVVASSDKAYGSSGNLPYLEDHPLHGDGPYDVSKSCTGNGSTQTINCGFGAGGARFVLIKRIDDVGDWYMYDTARGMTVLTDPYLLVNSTAAEVATLGSVTTVSTGFALNATILAAINTNAASYIFLAIA